MYPFLFIIFFFLFFFVVLNCYRRRKIIKKICHMDYSDKCYTLNYMLEPFGYLYLPDKDIFTSHIDAWQREYGYCSFYDKAALHFNMVFDCLPIYFDYDNKTWLIEFWKGQYGINTGAEAGIYYADKLLDKAEYDTTLFKSVENYEMPVFSFSLYHNGHLISRISSRHWWLTAFSLGYFSKPADLSMRIGITFNNNAMKPAFIKGLYSAGYSPDEINVLGNTVMIDFKNSFKYNSRLRHLRAYIAQLLNHLCCNIYNYVTRPFLSDLDRILYLYYFLPPIFRRTLQFRKYKKIP